MASLEIRLLGAFSAVVEGVPVEESRWVRKKAKSLVKMLALAPQRRMHREQLLEELWPDAEGETALNNFHKVLHAARRVLEPELKPGAASRYLITQESLLLLAPGPEVWIDVEAFESAAQGALRTGGLGELEAAEKLYTGPLLEEDLYENWASLRREQLKVLFERVLDRMAAVLEAQDGGRAVEVLERLVRHNATHEDGHRRLMRLYAAQDRRHLALEQFRVCKEALARELDTQPEAATVELYEQILAGEGTKSEAVVRPVGGRAEVRRPSPWRAILAVAALAVVASVGLWMWKEREGPKPLGPRSLAVLPMEMSGGEEGLEGFADGLTEGLINGASRLPGVRVMARTTVFAYRGDRNPLAIGKVLQVDSLLNGRLEKRANGGYRVSLELVDAKDGARLWGQQFVATAAELSRLQQKLDVELAGALAVPLSAAQRQSRVPTDNAEAYRLYLQGRYFSNQRTGAALRKSIGYFEEAVAKDPNYALAYAGLADSYGLLGVNNAAPGESMPKARAAAEKAIALDPGLAEAHTSLGMVRALFDWNWEGAEREFQAAIAANPGYATAHHWYGVHLGAMGRFEEAQKELDRARELDPLSPVIQVNSGYPALYQGRFEKAIEFYDRALELKPDFILALEDRMVAMEQLSRWEEATKSAVAFLRGAGEGEFAQEFEAVVKKAGYPAALRKWLERAEAGKMKDFTSPMTVAGLAVRAGEKQRAIEWLKKAEQTRSPMIVYTAVDPEFAGLRGDGQFVGLIERIGLKGARK